MVPPKLECVRDYMCLVFDRLFFFASFSRDLGVRDFFRAIQLRKIKEQAQNDLVFFKKPNLFLDFKPYTQS